MKTIEYKGPDKSEDYPEHGPWMDEPDKIQWLDEDTQMPCLIVRGPSGALCGYVGVNHTHPHFQKDYNDPEVSVHGGLTFASKCQETKDDNEIAVCHKVEENEDDNVWWFGFDCAHVGDLCPKNNHYKYEGDSYKTVEYVKAQVESLAQQLKDMY